MGDLNASATAANRLAALRELVDALPAQWPADPLKRQSRATLMRIVAMLNGKPQALPRRP